MVYGVVLYSIFSRRKWYIRTIVENGEVYTHELQDVTYQFPEIASKHLVEQCGLYDLPTTEEELSARVAVLTKLRAFEMRFEEARHRIPEIARSTSFYDSVAPPDPVKWASITLRGAAEKLLGRTDLTDMDLYAVQYYLFDAAEHFVSETRRFLQMKTFWVRPRQDLQDLHHVTDLLKRRSPVLQEFVSKARKIVTELREREAATWNEPPSRHPLTGVAWSDDDEAIIRFLLASLRVRRVIQNDPHAIPAAYIMKQLDLYSLELYDANAVHTFLVDLGIIAPWEELNTRRHSEAVEKTDVVSLVPTRPTPLVPPSLRPSDLYQHDVVESLRHDFGNLPVYVIDDWGAEELDDGISVERIPSNPDHVWLHVHIADPTALLAPTSELASEVMRALTSQYYVDRSVPMFPPSAGFHKFSLGNSPGVPDVAMTFSARVDSAGEIVEHKVQPSIIRNVQQIKYDEVNILLGFPKQYRRTPFQDLDKASLPVPRTFTDPRILEDLLLLQKVTGALEEARCRRGALLYGLPRAEMFLNPRPLLENLMGTTIPYEFRGFPDIMYTVLQSIEAGSRNIVAESMKVAGRVASLWLRDRGVPALRRSVGPLQSEQPGTVEKLLAQRGERGIIDPFVAMRAGVSSPSGQYLTVPGPHSLLGISADEGYMKVSSPLRRFGDLLAHWQLKHALLDPAQPVLFDRDWLARAATDFTVRELDAQRMETYQHAFWAHSFVRRWMDDPAASRRERDPLRELTGRVVEMPILDYRTKVKNCKVYVPQLGLTATVVDWPPERIPEPGDEVDVKINKVQIGIRPSLFLSLR